MAREGVESTRTHSVYNHERDTQFEEYLSARNPEYLRDNVRRAMGTEFGWVSSPVDVAEDLSRRDSVVCAGTVPGGVRPRTETNRTSSWESKYGLVSVPEAEEEAHDGGLPELSHQEGEHADKEALLGHRRENSHDSMPAGEPGHELEAMATTPKKRKWDA
jgi:hypothetical protein